jgi:hypothetical protein
VLTGHVKKEVLLRKGITCQNVSGTVEKGASVIMHYSEKIGLLWKILILVMILRIFSNSPPILKRSFLHMPQKI